MSGYINYLGNAEFDKSCNSLELPMSPVQSFSYGDEQRGVTELPVTPADFWNRLIIILPGEHET